MMDLMPHERALIMRSKWAMLVILIVGSVGGCAKSNHENDREVTDADAPREPVVAMKLATLRIAADDKRTQAQESRRQSGDLSGTLETMATQSSDINADQIPGRQLQHLISERTFTKGPDGELQITFGDLDLEKILNTVEPPPDVVDHFPDWLLRLDGQRIRVRGFMYPTFQSTGLAGFVLVRDKECLFGPRIKIHHMVEVAMRNGVTTEYIEGRPLDVIGVLRIRPEADGNKLWQLFQIEDAIVID